MAAIVVNGGQLVGQGDWDALAAQHGGVKGSPTLRAPTTAEITASASAGDDDPAGQQRPIYRYYFNDGTFVEARTASNGADYQVVDYKPSAKFTQSQSPSQSTAGQTTTTEGTPDPSKPGGFDNERPVKVTRDKNGNQVGQAVPLTGKDLEDWRTDREKSRNPGNKSDAEMEADAEKARQAQRQKEADDRANADRNKPGAPTLRPDGKGGTIAVQTMPDGSIRTTPLPGVPSDSPSVEVGGVRYEKGPDGKYAPAAGIPLPGAGLKNVDEFVPDYTQPDLGLGKWGAAQRQKIGKPAEAGGITQADYDKAATAAHQQAQVTIQNVTSNQQVTRQRAIDEQTQKQKLSDQSAADYGQAQGVFNDLWKYTKPGSRAIMDVIPGVMAEQKRYRAEREGQATAMPPLHPMFTNMATAAGVKPPAGSGPTPPVINAQTAAPSGVAAGLSAPPPAPVTAAAVPAPAPVAAAPAAPVQGPNPATPNLYPPAPAPAAPAPAVMPPTPVPSTGAAYDPPMANPGPGARGDGTTELLPQVGPDPSLAVPPIESAPAPGQPWPEPPTPSATADPNRLVWVRQSTGDGRLQQMPYSDFQAGAAQYGWVEVSDPSAIPGVDPGLPPITMAPQQQGPVTAWANNLVQPQQQPSQQAVNPALQTAQAGAAQPAAYDPYQTGGKLAAWGVPADAVAQAMKELGMIA